MVKVKKFEFKNFELNHRKSPMSIGVDSMLLGAWGSDLFNFKNAIDIGCGCGILAFMIAQKNSNAKILGIDIDEQAIVEANENLNNQKQFSNVSFKQIDIKTFITNDKFDFIISNPPYFSTQKSTQSPVLKRANARHNETLTLQTLFDFIAKNLSDNGKAALILPYQEFEWVQKTVQRLSLYFHKLTVVKPTEFKPVNRFLFIIGKENKFPEVDSIVLRNLDNTYTDQYKTLTKDFHSK